MRWFSLTLALLHTREAEVVLGVQPETNDRVIISPQNVPHNASRAISPSFPGFAFEEMSFCYYAADLTLRNKSNPNQVSQNLIQAITGKTQTQPRIRVGGTSLDNSSYHPDQAEPFIIPDSQKGKGIPKNIKIGPSYFYSFANFPQAQYVVDIPWATNDLSNSILLAKEVYKVIDASNIYALEIGNEPNNYHGNARPSGWSMADLASQWHDWSGNISKALGFSENKKIYQAIALSSETGTTGFPGGTA
ncbi:glycoside hydrolase family 79 protein, partial [Glonium stellatum]